MKDKIFIFTEHLGQQRGPVISGIVRLWESPQQSQEFTVINYGYQL